LLKTGSQKLDNSNLNSACGNSTSKKDSQTNAAKDFVSYLIRQGSITPEEVPSEAGLDSAATTTTAASSFGLGLSQPKVFQASLS
jgi:ATP-dependent RNA helicase A